MPQVNIAILGAPGVGKSIFVRRALGLREPPVGVGSSRKMLIGGVIYLVRLLEFQWHHLQLDDGDNDDPDVPPIRWPTRIDDLQVPPIHGALLVCDRTGASNTAAVIPRILGTCQRARALPLPFFFFFFFFFFFRNETFLDGPPPPPPSSSSPFPFVFHTSSSGESEG